MNSQQNQQSSVECRVSRIARPRLSSLVPRLIFPLLLLSATIAHAAAFDLFVGQTGTDGTTRFCTVSVAPNSIFYLDTDGVPQTAIGLVSGTAGMVLGDIAGHATIDLGNRQIFGLDGVTLVGDWGAGTAGNTGLWLQEVFTTDLNTDNHLETHIGNDAGVFISGPTQLSSVTHLIASEYVASPLVTTDALTVAGGAISPIIRLTGTMSSGVATFTNDVFASGHPWAIHTGSSIVSLGALTVSVSGTTATVKSANTLDGGTVDIFGVLGL